MTYTAPMVVRARRLAEEGWSATAISRQLKREFGAGPTRDTVRAWVDPDAAERMRESNIASKRRARARKPKSVSFIDGVMLSLRVEDELSYPTIAKVLRRFYSADVDGERVRARLIALGVEKDQRKARSAA